MIAELIIGFVIGAYVMIQIQKNLHGPNSNIVMKKVYQYEGKYYRYVPEICICPIKG